MENIVDLTMDLIKKSKNKGVTTAEIVRNVNSDELKKMREKQKAKLEAYIITDLSIDGRFLYTKKKWALKEDFTMDEIIKEQYRSLDALNEIEERENQENDQVEEIKMAINVDEGDMLEADDATVINDIDELDE